MPNPIPFRNLGQLGIIKDKNPFDLPPNCFSGGVNIRFDNGKAKGAPVFRRVVEALDGDDPMFCFGVRPSSGFDTVIYATETGRLYSYSSGSQLDITPLDFAEVSAPTTPYTACQLGDVVYINRAAGVPYAKGPADALFGPLPGWDASWSCRSLRAYKDYLIALNVTKGANAFPTMVKWSDATLFGQEPLTWDSTDPTHLAGENPLADLDSPFVDGMPLNDSFICYSQGQVWSMEESGDQFIFRFRKLFGEGGAINLNCVVEVDRKHYVFGTTDIYVHDGVQKQSIAANRVKDFIYRSMNVKNSWKFFVHHNPNLTEIYFCFESGDPDVSFRGTSRCNKAAVYNYRSDTWGFMELPNIASMTLANINSVLTYENAGDLTFDKVGGSYFDQEDSFQVQVAAVGCPWTDRTSGSTRAITASRLYGLDPVDQGSLAFNLDPECYVRAYAERIGIDLDEAGASLNMAKTLKRVYPQVTTFRNVPLEIQIGSSMVPSGRVTWKPQVSFDPAVQYKVDAKTTGRYLAMRYFVNSPADFEISGFDAEIASGGRR